MHYKAETNKLEKMYCYHSFDCLVHFLVDKFFPKRKSNIQF